MSVFLVKDADGDGVQALVPISTSTQTISNAGQVRFTLAADTRLVRIAANIDCYIKFGDSSVVATSSDLLFPTGAEVFSVNQMGYTHVSILGLGATPGVASVTKMV